MITKPAGINTELRKAENLSSEFGFEADSSCDIYIMQKASNNLKKKKTTDPTAMGMLETSTKIS